MLFTVSGVAVAQPWAGATWPPVADEQVQLLLGPIQTIAVNQPGSVVPITFSFAGRCKVIRST